MSIVIVVKVSEGLALAADSAATLAGKFQGPTGVVQEGILKTFLNARKLLQIGDFPIGVLTWGQSSIGLRTIESLVRQWEYEMSWRSVHEFKEKNSSKNYDTKECADGLYQYLKRAYDDEFKGIEQPPLVGILVAGYSERKFFPEIWRFVFPLDKEVVNQRPDVNGKPDFGASWFGMTDALVRLHWGRDDAVIEIIAKKFNVSLDEVHQTLLPLQYGVPFAQMPLQDAIEYAYFMVSLAIGRFRFAVGSQICGGAVDVAAVTQTRFDWISQKSLTINKD